VAFMGSGKHMLSYLASIGFPSPSQQNPCEFMLDLVNKDFTDANAVDNVINSWKPYAYPSPDGWSAQRNSVGSQFHIGTMFSRQLKVTVKDPILYIARMVMFFNMCVFFAIIYVRVRSLSQEQVLNRVFLQMWFTGPPSSMGVIAVLALNLECATVAREAKSGMYRTSSYLISQGILQVPMVIAMAICVLAVPNYVIANSNSDGFFTAVYLNAACLWSFECLAQFFSLLPPIMGILGYLNTWFMAFLFSGQFLKFDDVIWPFRLLCYTMPLRYGLATQVYNDMIDVELDGAVLCDTFELGCRSGFICPNISALQCFGRTGAQVLDSLHHRFELYSSSTSILDESLALVGIAATFKISFCSSFVSFKWF